MIAGECRSDQTIVFGMGSNPVPDDSIFLSDSQGAIAKANAGRIDVILALQFFELQAGMRRVSLKKPIGALGVPLSVEG